MAINVTIDVSTLSEMTDLLLKAAGELAKKHDIEKEEFFNDLGRLHLKFTPPHFAFTTTMSKPVAVEAPEEKAEEAAEEVEE